MSAKKRMWMRFTGWSGGVMLVVLAVVAGMPSQACGDLTIVKQRTDAGELTIYKLRVTPAGEPNPPLRHRLAVREIELKPGNAATHYLRAFPEAGVEARLKRLVEQHGDVFHDWYRPEAIPLNELPLAEARQAADSFEGIVENLIAPATVRRDCDWGLGIEEMRGPGVVEVWLPEFQASRSISRILTLRARVAVAELDYGHAIDQLRMNYRLAEHVGSQPLLICGLIGIAEAFMGNQQVIELIAAADSPNLYWALAELPDPIVDIGRAIRFEMSLGLRIFPFLIDAETANHTPGEWARVLAESLADFGRVGFTTSSGNVLLPGAVQWRQAIVAGLSVPLYPAAKQRLVAGGMTAKQVEAMPVGQVIAIDAAREYRRVADEIEKWAYVPYHVARQQKPDDLFLAHGLAAIERGFGYTVASLLLPAVEAARAAEARLQWQMRAIQVVEAIRMHAADAGALPATLDQIKRVPVPVNPATDEPYEYELKGKTAVLNLPFSDGFPGGIAWRFEITLAE